MNGTDQTEPHPDQDLTQIATDIRRAATAVEVIQQLSLGASPSSVQDDLDRIEALAVCAQCYLQGIAEAVDAQAVRHG